MSPEQANSNPRPVTKEVLERIKACNHCLSYNEIGTMGPVMVCNNPESPYFDEPDHLEEGGSRRRFIQLYLEEQIKGCHVIQHDRRKLPAKEFAFVPSASVLRTLPAEQVMEEEGELPPPKHTLDEVATAIVDCNPIRLEMKQEGQPGYAPTVLYFEQA